MALIEDKTQVFTRKELAIKLDVTPQYVGRMIAELGLQPVGDREHDAREDGRGGKRAELFSYDSLLQMKQQQQQQQFLLKLESLRQAHVAKLTDEEKVIVVRQAFESLHDDVESSQVALLQIIQNIHPEVCQALCDHIGLTQALARIDEIEARELALIEDRTLQEQRAEEYREEARKQVINVQELEIQNKRLQRKLERGRIRTYEKLAGRKLSKEEQEAMCDEIAVEEGMEPIKQRIPKLASVMSQSEKDSVEKKIRARVMSEMNIVEGEPWEHEAFMLQKKYLKELGL